MTLLVSGLALAGCSRAGEHRREHNPEGGADSAERLQLERDKYIKASIEIGCLTRQETDPHRLASMTLNVYRRYGFDDVMSYLALVERVGQEKSVQQEITDGLKSCP